MNLLIKYDKGLKLAGIYSFDLADYLNKNCLGIICNKNIFRKRRNS